MSHESDAEALGRAAFIAGKMRQPMKDHALIESLQQHGSEDHSPYSPGAKMNAAERQRMEDKIKAWKRGWDEENTK